MRGKARYELPDSIFFLTCDCKKKTNIRLMVKAREDIKIPHRKALVLSSLRRKKLLHEILEKRIHSLETLDAVLMKLQNAASDAEVSISRDFQSYLLWSGFCSDHYLKNI